ncbi:hypothetical protein D3C75_722480 [compost metagenome]
MPVEIIRDQRLKRSLFDRIGMVIHDIHNHRNTFAVQRLHHFLKLADAGPGIIRICAVRAFRNVIMLRVITPVILRVIIRPGGFTGSLQLIHGLKIKYRQQMHMSNPEFN